MLFFAIMDPLAHHVLVPMQPANDQLAHIRAPADEHRQPQEEDALLQIAKFVDALRSQCIRLLAQQLLPCDLGPDEAASRYGTGLVDERADLQP